MVRKTGKAQKVRIWGIKRESKESKRGFQRCLGDIGLLLPFTAATGESF